MLNIKDLAVNKELHSNDMARIAGGWHPMMLLDGSTRLKNKVADVEQLFDFALNQGNAGEVTNNQAIAGGNGIVYAPVDQTLKQDNHMDLSGIGNTRVY